MNLDHWYVLYFFITLTTGIFSLGIVTLTYLKTKDTLIRYYLYFCLAFTLLVMSDIFSSYMDANFPEPDGDPRLLDSLENIWIIATIHLLAFTIPVLMHDLFSVSHQKLKNIIVGVMVLLCFSLSQWFELLPQNALEEFALLEEFGEILLFVMILYSFLLGLSLYKKLQDRLRKRYAQKLLLFFGISLAVLLEDSFLSLLP